MEDNEILTLGSVLKSGVVNPTDVTLSGSLTPKQGRAFANAIVDSSKFLKKITVDITGKLTKERSSLDAAKGMLVRHTPGTATPDANLRGLSLIGATLNMVNTVKLEASITEETLQDNQDNPSFEKEQFAGFSTAFGNDLMYLGIIGTDDNTAANAPFAELAKGWPVIAAASGDTIKIAYPASTTATDGAIVLEALSRLRKAANADIRGTMAIVMSLEDYDSYVDYIADHDQNTAVLLSGEAFRYKGNELIPMADIPKGIYIGSPIKNFILGFAKNIIRARWYSNEISALKYKFTVAVDYEFDIKKYVTLVTTAYAPTGFADQTIADEASGGFTINWLAPSGGDSVDSYIVDVDVAGTAITGSPFTVTGTTLTKAVSGLDAETAHNTKVTAVNGGGSLATSTVVATTTA